MTTVDIQRETAPPRPNDAGAPSTTLLAVVGFDGSAPSRAALDAAVEMMRGRPGHLEVVYVAHLSLFVGASAEVVTGMREGFDVIAAELCASARETVRGREPRWHFQRRDGAIAAELAAAAREVQREHGPDATAVIVVGASARLAHHVAGSVAVALARETEFPLLVVPAEPAVAHPGVKALDSSIYLG